LKNNVDNHANMNILSIEDRAMKKDQIIACDYQACHYFKTMSKKNCSFSDDDSVCVLTEISKSEPAYPAIMTDNTLIHLSTRGINVRDYYFSRAIAGILSSQAKLDSYTTDEIIAKAYDVTVAAIKKRNQ
jgi:hypothetical protein